MKRTLLQFNHSRSLSSILCCFFFLFSAFSAFADNVRDEFTTVSYSNNDGNTNWTTDWLEITEGDGPALGSIQVVTDLGSGRLKINGNNKGVQREVNLAGATLATLTLNYRRESLDRGNEYVNVEISSDGGASWTQLVRYKGPQTDVSYQSSLSYDITPYISANTRIRLLGSPNLDTADAVYFDNIDITYTAPSLAHFAIIHDGVAGNCLPKQITLTMHTAAHAVDTTYTGTVTLTSSTGNGNWTKTTTSTDAQGTLTPGALDSGTATYTFVAADNGSIVLNLANTNVETLNINITDGLNTENITEDPALSFSSLSTLTFRDEFLTASYTNNNGSALWASDWLEIVETDGAGTGDIQISSGQLQISGSNKGLQRAVDLTGSSAATLTLEHRRVSLENGNEYVNLEISSDGGITWVELDRFKGPQNDVSNQLTSYNITPYISATTRIRLLGSSGLDSTTDFVYFDNVEIASSSTVTCALIDHYSINYLAGATGTGVNCQEQNITVAAHDASHNIITTHTGSISLSTSTTNGDWSKTTTATDANGTLTAGTADSGSATYSFITADAGSVILNFKDTHVETTNLNINGSGILETSNTAVANDDYAITFAASGFIFNNETDLNTIIPTQLSGKGSNIGYNAKTLTLQAVRISDSDPAQCLPAFQNKTLNINFAAECINPSTCITSQLFNLTSGAVTGNLTATTDNNSIVGTSSSYDTRSITFDADGKANIIFNYPEAGVMELHAHHNILQADGITPSGNFMTGSSTFVVRPFAFYTAIVGNPSAITAAGAPFTSAGTNFTVNVQAIGWQQADDDGLDVLLNPNGIANDGIADGHELTDTDPSNNTNLADNAVTKNYGQESTTEEVALNSLLNLPSPGNDPDINDTSVNGRRITSFNVATGMGSTSTINYPEVGIIEISSTVNDVDYLGIGATETAKLIGKSGYVGRFHPHHFDTEVTQGCNNVAPLNSFTYSGQPFRVKAIAKNNLTAPTTTLNYNGDFAKDTEISDAITGTTTLFSNNSIKGGTAASGGQFINGEGQTSLITSTTAPLPIKYTFSTKDTPPVNLTLRARDADTATAAGTTEASMQIRSGRLRLENVFGPELTSLTMPVKAEYYSDNTLIYDPLDPITTQADDGFILNTDDSCTTFDVTAAALTNYTSNLSSGETILTSTGTISAGLGNINFSAPGADNEGSVNLLLNNTSSPSWLSYNWNIDCDNADTDDDITTGIDAGLCGPYGTASFGLYRGDDRVIYWREVF